MTAMTPAPPLDLSHHYSYTTRNRNPSSIKDFYKYFLIPGIANFAGGAIPLSVETHPTNKQRFQASRTLHISPTTLSKPPSPGHSGYSPPLTITSNQNES